MPRSGTTWLARELAAAPAAALPGKEPMNPRDGQFALGGTLTGWTELSQPTAKQAGLLRRVYAGREPRTFSRYGVKQWAAPLPWTTPVVKDPFALLAVPAVVRVTGAVPVVVYRHPGAVLASYRRMGWTASTADVRRLQGRPEDETAADDVSAMAEMWVFLHSRVLSWLPAVPTCLVVSHAELSLGGAPALAALRERVGLRPVRVAPARPVVAPPSPAADSGTLHRFDRSPEEVAQGWRTRLTQAEVDLLERVTGPTYEAVQAVRQHLP